MAKGIIKRYEFRKGFGFIVDEKSGEDYFFHKSEWQGDGPIRKGLAVKFVNKESDKGPQAESVMPLDAPSKKSSKNPKPQAKPATLEERVASLESTVTTWKVISLLAFAGMVALAVEKYIL
ncbi:cold-shock protein [Aliikangiella sp. IMCC44653]